MTLAKKMLVLSLFLLSLMALYPLSGVGATDYSPPWSYSWSNYNALCYPSGVNTANAAASASRTSVSVYSYSVAWIGGAGAIAIAQQSYQFVAPKTATYKVSFNYRVDGKASIYGFNPQPIVSLGGGIILNGLVSALTNLAVSQTAKSAIVGLLKLKNYGVQAVLTFDFAGVVVKQYTVYSNQG
jgi:hypothetical protein